MVGAVYPAPYLPLFCEGAMKRFRRVGLLPLLSLVLCVSINLPAYAQVNRINAATAKQHVGERATVCGVVVTARYARPSNGQPTFLNLDKSYPKQIFTVVIWGSNRAKFGSPENKYRDKKICATGNIIEYRGVPEMIISDPAQIQVGSEPSRRSSRQVTLIPAGATAECRDGSYSFSQHRRGTCSHHGGVSRWLTQ
jgi:Protein of unknown function (DUF3761)